LKEEIIVLAPLFVQCTQAAQGGYAPTNTVDNYDPATTFFAKLQNTISSVPQDHMLVISEFSGGNL
jgi:hypothetical protein